ncbi:hypothetical protein HLB44_12505 [Aquincola sp. S2]|uniref:Peptidase C45 hydrolase domain-containing protein n=1 Tax=Pseudaquabacterium terrae TaxID=2732868 RepID=A0ABX2EGS3_9BURK|nr:C45 family peptidase [Aquabacterium terrae]NRF67806.1 hypothetical protein [Aquabacterium terrae]
MRWSIEAIEENAPGPKWQQHFRTHWPAYQSWFLRGGMGARRSYTECRRALRKHMPLWEPVWERLVDLAGGGDIEARFMSLWCPPPYIAGCSQAVWTGHGDPVLVRNYDYAPALLEGAWLATRWGGQRVIAVSDCLCGALDGINESGLAASLSFGGRKARGEGFGIPLVVRYVLEYATTTREAVRLLSSIPVHMTYTVTLLDRFSNHSTVFVAPDRPAEVVPLAGVTNHQHAVEWAEHAAATNTVQRGAALNRAVLASGSKREMVDVMLAEPLFQTSYERGYGTLYTAVYQPAQLSAELVWRTGTWRQSIDAFDEGRREIRETGSSGISENSRACEQIPPAVDARSVDCRPVKQGPAERT